MPPPTSSPDARARLHGPDGRLGAWVVLLVAADGDLRHAIGECLRVREDVDVVAVQTVDAAITAGVTWRPELLIVTGTEVEVLRAFDRVPAIVIGEEAPRPRAGTPTERLDRAFSPGELLALVAQLLAHRGG
jgi:hypothetical protein